MNSFQAMHFVDKASPQQLKAMVDTQSPYSFMALAKLQQIRDAAMRQKAYEPTPPPLSQQIPQEIAKAEAPAIPQTPVGIAAMVPQMPQQPQAGIGPEMATAAAGGGLVAFREGGVPGFNGANDYAPSFLTEYLDELRERDKPYVPRYTDIMRQMRGERIDPATNLPAPAVSGSQSRLRPLGATITPVPNRAAAEAAAVRRATDTTGYNEPMNLSANTAATPSGSASVTPNLTPIPVSNRGAAPSSAVASGLGSLGFTPGIQARAALDAAGEKLNRLEGLRGNTPERVAAMGDLEAERKARLQALREEMPDRLAPYEKELKDEREKLGKGNEDIKNQALLNVALGLLNPKGTGGQGLGGLLSAVGEAGKSGLSEFNKLKAIQDERAEKLRGLEMNLAVQREARDRGQFDMAQRAAESERNLRMDLYKSDNALAAQTVMANVQLELHRADMPYKDADLKLKQISAQLQAMQSNRPQEWEQKVMLANAIGQRTNQDPGKILSQMVLGSVEGRQEERAASVAANAIKDMPNFTPEDQAAKRAAFNEMYNAIMSGMTGGLSYDPKTKSLTGGK